MLINTHWVYSTRRGSRISRIRSFWRIAMCLFQRSCVLVRGMNIQNNVDFFEEYRVKWSWQKSNKWGGNEPTWNSRYLNILRPHEPTSIPSQSITSSKLGSSTSVVTISVACHFGRPTSRFLDAESDTYAAVSWFIRFIHETAVGDGNLMKILDETNHETAAGGDPPSWDDHLRKTAAFVPRGCWFGKPTFWHWLHPYQKYSLFRYYAISCSINHLHV